MYNEKVSFTHFYKKFGEQRQACSRRHILCYIDILCRSWTASTKTNGLKQGGDGPGYKLLDFAKRLTTVI